MTIPFLRILDDLGEQIREDGLPRVVRAINEKDETSYLVLFLDGLTLRSVSTAEWLESHSDLPSAWTEDQIKNAIREKRDREDQKKRVREDFEKSLLKSLSEIEGVPISSLTFDQLKVLVMGLCWERGILQSDLSIRLPFPSSRRSLNNSSRTTDEL